MVNRSIPSGRAWSNCCAAAVPAGGLQWHCCLHQLPLRPSPAFLALVALAHDVAIVCGVFAWLGIVQQLEVDSLFAVSLPGVPATRSTTRWLCSIAFASATRCFGSASVVAGGSNVSATLTRPLHQRNHPDSFACPGVFWWGNAVLVCDRLGLGGCRGVLVEHRPGTLTAHALGPFP